MKQKYQFVLSCEHASNEIPDAYGLLFKKYKHLLKTHRGYDIGSAELTDFLATNLQAPVVKAKWSRLLVDVNRSLYRRTLFSEISKILPASEKQRLLELYYFPYQQEIKETVQRVLKRDNSVFHLALHSFTPVYHGEERKVDVGILYNPERTGERRIALRWRRALKQARPDLVVKLNRPYRGKPDGVCARFRKELSDRQYAGFELEVNQKFYRDSKKAETINRLILSTISRLIDEI